MPSSCWAPNCSNRLGKGSSVKVFRFPVSNVERYNQWLVKIARLPPPGMKSKRPDGLHEPKEHDRICSVHFVKGRPSDDPLDVDYVPTLFSHRTKFTPSTDRKRLQQVVSRTERSKEREVKKQRLEIAQSLLSLGSETERSTGCQTDPFISLPASTQTEITASDINNLNERQVQLANRTAELKASLLLCKQKFRQLRKEKTERHVTPKALFGVGIIENNDVKTKYYTGLPNFATFLHVVNCAASIVSNANTQTSAADCTLITMLKIRHNRGFEDISYSFGLSKSLVVKIFYLWLDGLYRFLGGLIVWPASDEVKLPSAFQNSIFQRVRCIIDCTEVFIARPSGLKARAQTYSNYKHHNTVKFLIGVSPSGCVTFLSPVWGGRASDRVITMESGLLDKLYPGDVVLADRGFTMTEEFAMRGVKLMVPSFTKGKKQLTAEEVEKSRQLSRARIHVERVIGRVKDMKILRDTLPISLVMRKGQQEVATIDKIITVACAVVNMNNPVL